MCVKTIVSGRVAAAVALRYLKLHFLFLRKFNADKRLSVGRTGRVPRHRLHFLSSPRELSG